MSKVKANNPPKTDNKSQKVKEKFINSGGFFYNLRARVLEILILCTCFSLLFTCPYPTERTSANFITQEVCSAGDALYDIFRHTPVYPYYYKYGRPILDKTRNVYNKHGRPVVEKFSSNIHEKSKGHSSKVRSLYEDNLKKHILAYYPKIEQTYHSVMDPICNKLEPVVKNINEKAHQEFNKYSAPVYKLYDEKVGAYINDACCRFEADCCDSARHLKDRVKYGFAKIANYYKPESNFDKIKNASNKISDDISQAAKDAAGTVLKQAGKVKETVVSNTEKVSKEAKEKAAEAKDKVFDKEKPVKKSALPNSKSSNAENEEGTGTEEDIFKKNKEAYQLIIEEVNKYSQETLTSIEEAQNKFSDADTSELDELKKKTHDAVEKFTNYIQNVSSESNLQEMEANARESVSNINQWANKIMTLSANHPEERDKVSRNARLLVASIGYGNKVIKQKIVLTKEAITKTFDEFYQIATSSKT